MVRGMQRQIPIILIGMKHCGKTTIGRLLAHRRGAGFHDLDAIMLKRTGDPALSSARDLYVTRGEAAFRTLEAEASADLARMLRSEPDAVAALGGGTAANVPAMSALRGAGCFVFIEESPEVLFERIRRGGLPPFLSPEDPYGHFLRLFAERTKSYREHADLVLPLRGHDPQSAVRLLEELIKEHDNVR